jgi:hypothetical protein
VGSWGLRFSAARAALFFDQTPVSHRTPVIAVTKSLPGKQPIVSTSRYSESLLLRVERGTLARVDNVLERFEDRSHMLREAIEREIERRKRQQR